MVRGEERRGGDGEERGRDGEERGGGGGDGEERGEARGWLHKLLIVAIVL